MYRLLEPDFEFEDNRGRLVQLVHGGYTQINILTTKQGVARGGHYHKKSREAFYIISGSVDITLSKGDKGENIHFSTGTFFEINPNTVHEMAFTEDCVMIAMYDRPVEDIDGQKDIFAV